MPHGGKEACLRGLSAAGRERVRGRAGAGIGRSRGGERAIQMCAEGASASVRGGGGARGARLGDVGGTWKRGALADAQPTLLFAWRRSVGSHIHRHLSRTPRLPICARCALVCARHLLCLSIHPARASFCALLLSLSLCFRLCIYPRRLPCCVFSTFSISEGANSSLCIPRLPRFRGGRSVCLLLHRLRLAIVL